MKFDYLPKIHAPKSLKKSDLLNDPKAQLLSWLERAREAKIEELNAMTLATASAEGRPSCRTVLLKEVTDKGLLFFTNYTSRKAIELLENPRAMATLFWGKLMRQVSFEGAVVKTEREISEKYFATRPKGSRLSAWSSPQDQVIPSYQFLRDAYDANQLKYESQEVPLPPFWGGFYLNPDRYEFWQAGKDRLHDRFQYIKAGKSWKIERLAP